MIVRDLVNRLMQYVREGELCSCPIIMRNENKVELAVFTYFASDGVPQTVFGYRKQSAGFIACAHEIGFRRIDIAQFGKPTAHKGVAGGLYLFVLDKKS